MLIDSTLLDLLRCPVTGERLRINTQTHLENLSGTEQYPVIHGIPDFRRFDPPYLTREEEAAAADRMIEASASLSYLELLSHFERNIYPRRRNGEQIEKSIEHRQALFTRSPKRLDQLIATTNGNAEPRGCTLDLGCGSGEATAALLRRGADKVIGVDISLTELILAKKLLSEQGLSAHLVAACAEALPFERGSVDFIYSPDVIEHVTDQNLYLQEARRILKPNGELLLNSPNRYSIVCPEPHVGIWFLGFLPRALMDPVCRLAGRGPYQGKRLVSLIELRTLLASSFDRHTIYSRRSNPNAESLAGRMFYATRILSEPAFALVCDQFVIHAQITHSTN